MKNAKSQLKAVLSTSLKAILVACLLANLTAVTAYADDAGFALRFDGTTDYVELPQTATILATGWESNKSVSLWVKPDGSQSACTTTADPNAVAACDSIFGDRPTFWGIAIGYLAGPAQNRIWVWNYDGVAPTSYDFIGIDYFPGVWVHITLVHNGGTLYAYKNGVLAGSTPSGPTVQPPTGGPILNLGGIIQNSTNYWMFQGDIDEVSLWNRALSSTEISANMYVATPPDTTGLAAFYRMSNGSGTVLTDDSGNGRTGNLKDGRVNVLPGNGTYPLWVDSGAFDIAGPAVIINQAPGQPDPTNGTMITYNVVFSEPVTGFDSPSDVDLTASTAGGPLSASVSGSGTSYTVTVSGMSSTGTVVASIPAGVAQNGAALTNSASSSTDNTVTYDVTGPTVTINQAPAQLDPTNASPVNFQVIFNESVSDFTNADVNLSGTAPGTLSANVTGSGTTYNVAVSGMTGSGTVIASIPAGVAHDSLGNASSASSSTDNTVTYDTVAPTVTINQASGQGDPTNTSPVNFQVVFSEAVSDFGDADVSLSGAAGATTASVTGSGTTYNVAVSGMTSSGTVIASVPAGGAHDAAGNANTASTSSDNTVMYNITGPTVTINQAPAQLDPTNASPVNFQVIFSETVSDFATGDVSLSGTAGATTANVSGSGTTYNVAVSGMTGNGTVIATIAAGVAHDGLGNPSQASTSTDNSVTYDTVAPSVTINKAPGQLDPTTTSPINFQVIFSEAVSDFNDADMNITGTAGATTANVTGSGTTYNVAVSGMTSSGTVIASIPAGRAHDAAGNANTISTSTDNEVDFDNTVLTVTINQAPGQLDPTNASPINFQVVFNKTVDDFGSGDVSLSGTAGPATASVTGSGTTYNVAVSGMTGNGTVIAAIPAGVAHDTGGTPNTASVSTDHTVTYDTVAPTVTINKAPGQLDPTPFSPIVFRVVFSQAVSDFTSADVSLSGTATGALSVLVTGGGTTYTVSISGMTSSGTVRATIPAGRAHDAAGNANTASTSSDDTVAFQYFPFRIYLPAILKP